MPFIDVKASCEITLEQELRLKTGLGKAIEAIPGKDESLLMLQFTGGAHMWFAGKPGRIVMVNTAIFGQTAPEAFQRFGQEAVALFKEVLNADQVYVKLAQTTDWAW